MKRRNGRVRKDTVMDKDLIMKAGVLIIPTALGILFMALWIWALVHSGRRLGSGDQRMLGWVIAIALTHVIGALAYFLFGRSRLKPAEQNQPAQ
jgi:hypothetical protein